MSTDLPHNHDAEDVVVGSLVLSSQAIKSALDAGLDSDDFTREWHRQVVQAAVTLWARGDAVDPTSLKSMVPELDLLALVDCEAKVTDSSNVATHVDIVRRCAAGRQAIGVVHGLDRAARNGSDLVEALDDSRRHIIRIRDRLAGPSEVLAADLFIDWPPFFSTDHGAADWLFPDVLARGRAHAIYARHKQGKSLFTFWVALQLATGPDPVAVAYFDFEMTNADVYERLEDMGYGPGTDLSRLHYALLPSLPPLNTAQGGDAVSAALDRVQAQHPDHHLFVVIDTTGRAVAGEENSADTIQDYYRHTGIRLKQRGATSVRLDHAGKDAEKGQRGSSAKGDDVDVIWKLSRMQGGIVLKREPARIAWVPERVQYAEGTSPLRYVRTGEQFPVGTDEVAALLDAEGVPVATTANDAFRTLKNAGKGRSRALVLAAVRWRKDGPR